MSVTLSPAELRSVQGLRLVPRRTRTGHHRGERITKRKGISLEFADHRDYVEGDDLRHLDWNVLARLGQPVVKTYQDEEDLSVYLLVDTTASLDFGEPAKYVLARKLAAAVAMVALATGDAVRPYPLGSTAKTVPLYRGMANFGRVMAQINSYPRQQKSSVSESLRQFARVDLPPGVVVILSDGLDPEFPEALRAVASRGHEPWLLTVLSRNELEPDLEGELKLLDAESNEAVEVTANRSVVEEYLNNLDVHLKSLRDACVRGGGRFAHTASDTPLESVIHRALRKEGWVA
ncbi:MAG: DUF58 domain-containing protein [Fimbriimonadaceae bacterium]|nr:DUF58 domain-containing protein [Fimbriimonadaceae bacterium]